MSRTLAKTLTYSLMHLMVAVGVAYALTRNWHVALGIGLIEPLVQTIAYSFHERAWERLWPPYGKPKTRHSTTPLLAEPA